MNKYSQSKIYVIRNHANSLVYVGSTTELLCRRMCKHRSDSLQEKVSNYKVYKAFHELGVENFYIELIENYPCENKEELRQREGYWIRHFNSVNEGYNGVVAGRDTKMYYEENKELRLHNAKKRYETNRDLILEQNRARNAQIIVCECGKSIRKDSIYKHKRSKKHLTLMQNHASSS
jgi:group I intron endonuclease